MSYTIDQIADDKYTQICNYFLELAKDEITKSKLKEILYEGKIDDYYFENRVEIKDNSFIEGCRRISYAKLLIRNPETFDYLVKNHIIFFHGTNSRALISILEHGLCSFDYLKKNKIRITTGETNPQKFDSIFNKDFVAFTSTLYLAEFYSSIFKGEDDFEIILGTSEDKLTKNKKAAIGSTAYPEVWLKDKVPLDSIEIICVPSSKVDYVKELIGNHQIKVLAFDDVEKKFYDFDFFNNET